MKTKTKILKVFAIVAMFLGSTHLMAQTLPLNTSVQTVCVNTSAEPYEMVPNPNSTYSWSIIDQATGLVPAAGVADITTPNPTNDWWIEIDWNIAGIYELSVVETDVSTLCEGSSVLLIITVENLANLPVATNPAPICLNDGNPQITASTGGGTGNSVFNWYSDAGLTTLLQTNSVTYTEPLLYPSAGTYDYWVTEESANGCEGSATIVTITVTPLPTAPTLVSLPYVACFGDPTNPLMTAVGTGSNFNWYEDNLVTPGTPGTQVATNSNTYPSTEVNPATYIYYVEEVVGSCTSPQTTFTFTIFAPPAAPSITPDPIEICEGDVPGNFTANTGGAAGTFTWYSDAALINVIPGATAICPPTQIIPGVYDYYLTETHPTTACISPSSQATFEIFELPLQPTVSASSSAIICEGQLNPVFTAAQGTGSTGTSTFNWYNDDPANPGAILLLSAVNPFLPSQTLVGSYTFWVTETNSTTLCEGDAFLFTFEIVALPAVPTLIPNPIEICFGDANPAIIPTAVTSSGTNLEWYIVDPVANPLVGSFFNGASFTAPTSVVGSATSVTTYSYWVVDEPGNCTSLPLQVDLQINPIPTPGPIYHN